MQKFRKKPVVIEAVQFNDLDDYLKIVQWMKDSGDTCALANEVYFTTPLMLIPTLEGMMAANPGDYIIRGVKNEFYPCKPDIFEATYEVVEMSDESAVGEDLSKSLHLPDGSIRQSICEHLRFSGYEVDPESLRIYGYGDDEKKELSAFQGHITITEWPEPHLPIRRIRR